MGKSLISREEFDALKSVEGREKFSDRQMRQYMDKQDQFIGLLSEFVSTSTLPFDERVNNNIYKIVSSDPIARANMFKFAHTLSSLVWLAYTKQEVEQTSARLREEIEEKLRQEQMSRPYLTVKEFCERTGMHGNTVRKYIRVGLITNYIEDGRGFHVHYTEIENFTHKDPMDFSSADCPNYTYNVSNHEDLIRVEDENYKITK